MDLDFSAEQDMLREMVRGLCASASSLDTVRELEDDAVGYSTDLWRQLGELDLIGLLLPEEYGGSGMSALEGCVLYEEFGRALVSSPHFVSAVMGGGVLVRSGSDEQRRSLLPGIVNGSEILTTAWLEAEGGFGARSVRTTATADGDGFRLDGEKWHVPFASSATRLVVLARTGPGDAAVDLFLVDPTATGVTLRQQFALASDNQYAVTLDGVHVSEADRIGPAGSGWETWDATLLEGAIFLAAQAIGGARAALEITNQYAKDREQFDKPLGAFQAIAHYLADASTAVEGGEILVHEAAWAHANGQPIAQLAPMAKLFAGRTYRDVTAMGEQIFGGVGFTLEYDIQLYFRRAKQAQISWWDDRILEERIAATILDERSASLNG